MHGWSSIILPLSLATSLFPGSFSFSPLSSRCRQTFLRMESSSVEKTPITHPAEAKGVLFDIDGTLADSWKLGFDATQVVLKNNDVPLITEELYHECTRYATPDRLARHAGIDPKDEKFWAVGNSLAEEFDDLYVGLVSLQTAGFYPGVLGLITDMPNAEDGVKVAALTNACVAYAHAVLKINCPVLGGDSKTEGQEGIYSKFLSIHGADTVPKPKPHPDGLFKCCEEIGVLPEKCVYVGDSPSDAVAAKASGMLAIGVLWGSHPVESLKEAPFDYLCKDIAELRDLLPAK